MGVHPVLAFASPQAICYTLTLTERQTLRVNKSQDEVGNRLSKLGIVTDSARSLNIFLLNRASAESVSKSVSQSILVPEIRVTSIAMLIE